MSYPNMPRVRKTGPTPADLAAKTGCATWEDFEAYLKDELPKVIDEILGEMRSTRVTVIKD
jgi:hypothetical protein